MSKRILIACAVAAFGVWIALSMLGRRMLPGAPLRKAWIVLSGANGWEFVMMGMADKGMTRESLTRKLGDPQEISVSTRNPEQVFLHYTNPHDRKRDVSFAIGADQRVMYAAPGRGL